MKKGKPMWKMVTARIPVITMMLSMVFLPVTAKADTTVYTTATGTHYHLSRSCNGLSNAKNIYEDTLSHAQASNLEPCELCCTGSSSSGSTSAQSNQTEAPSQASATAQSDTSVQAATETQTAERRKVNINDYLKITGIRKAKDGTWVSMKLKNVSGKAVRISPYIAVQDKNKYGFAWSQPVKKSYTAIGKGKQKEFKFICYDCNNYSNPKPKVKSEPIKYNSRQLSYALPFSCGNTVYYYFNNPSKKMKKCIIFDSNTFDNDIDQWLNPNNR